MDQQPTIKTKSLYLGAAIMALVITTAIVAGTTNARGLGNGFMPGLGKAPNENATKQVAMQTIFENNDYAAWKAEMTQRQNEMAQAHQKIMTTITEENFPRFAEMHRLMMAGDFAGAKVISEELGLPGWQGKGMPRGGRGNGGGCPHLQATTGTTQN